MRNKKPLLATSENVIGIASLKKNIKMVVQTEQFSYKPSMHFHLTFEGYGKQKLFLEAYIDINNVGIVLADDMRDKLIAHITEILFYNINNKYDELKAVTREDIYKLVNDSLSYIDFKYFEEFC